MFEASDVAQPASCIVSVVDDHYEPASWTLLTNHGAVLLYVAVYPDATIREIAEGVDITERATARILSQLREDGYVVATRQGRRNSYTIASELPMRHAVARTFTVAQLLAGLLTGATVPVEEAAQVIRIVVRAGNQTKSNAGERQSAMG